MTWLKDDRSTARRPPGTALATAELRPHVRSGLCQQLRTCLETAKAIFAASPGAAVWWFRRQGRNDRDSAHTLVARRETIYSIVLFLI